MKGRSPGQFIVYCEQRYNNKVGDLIVNTDISVKDHHFTNRVGKVINIPSAWEQVIEIGDEVIVHHNVFRLWYDVRGVETEATGFLEDNHYLVNYDEIFGYKRNGEWNALPGYCFVKPVKPESIWNTTGETHLKGVMVMPSPGLEPYRDHVVGFTPESEYEFNIDGERIYRVYEHHITFDYGSEETKKENNHLIAESA